MSLAAQSGPAQSGPVEVSPGDAAQGGPAAPRHRLADRLGLGRLSGVYVWAAFIVIYAVWIPHTFLTVATAQSVAGDQAITGIVALGLVFALAAGAFDLSFATLLTMSSVVCGSMMAVWRVPSGLAILATLAAGIAVGVINGLLVTRIGISSIVATLGMSSLIQAVIDRVTNGGQFITGFPKSFTDLASPEPFGVPVLAIYLVVLAFGAWYLLEHSPFGRRLQATGAGPDAARLAGVSTDRMVFAGLVASSTAATIGGILVTSQIGSVSPTIGSGYLLPVFAAVFLGTTQIKVGRFNVWGTMVAIYLLATGVKGLQLGGGEGWITDAFNGVALLLAVSLAVLGQRRRGGSRLLPRAGLWRRRPHSDQTASGHTVKE
ncbi:MAG TPA: ABC transporter permease [Streptosporangiaceae bacterium]|nr:ABC transporter permease [Streptosporangiaceae bacterium]